MHKNQIQDISYAFAGLIYTNERILPREISPRFMTSLLERSLINIAKKRRHWKGCGDEREDTSWKVVLQTTSSSHSWKENAWTMENAWGWLERRMMGGRRVTGMRGKGWECLLTSSRRTSRRGEWSEKRRQTKLDNHRKGMSEKWENPRERERERES